MQNGNRLLNFFRKCSYIKFLLFCNKKSIVKSIFIQYFIVAVCFLGQNKTLTKSKRVNFFCVDWTFLCCCGLKSFFLIYVCMLQIIKPLKKLCCVFFVYFFVPSLLFNALTPIYIYYLIQDLITSCPECRHWTKKIVYFQYDNFCMLFHSKQTLVVLFTLIWVWTQAKLFEILKWERERLNFIYMLPYLEVNKWEDGCLMVWVEITKRKI